jgi:hypothetical protein
MDGGKPVLDDLSTDVKENFVTLAFVKGVCAE